MFNARNSRAIQNYINRQPRRKSTVSDSGISGSGNDDKDSGLPLLERLLQYKTSVKDIIKHVDTDEGDSDSISGLEIKLGDDEETQKYKSMQMKESIKNLRYENIRFSKQYREVLQEMESEEEVPSLPCSTCSVCSSCTTDTWELLNISDDSFVIKPTPLDPKVISEFKELSNKYTDVIKKMYLHETKSNDGSSETEIDQFGEEEEIEEGKLTKFKSEIAQKSEDFYWSDADYFQTSISKYDDFFITPPDYNYYRDTGSRYIRYEKDTTPWNVKERSRKKCSEWLNNCHD